MRGFLLRPTGWFLFQLAEVALLMAILVTLREAFGDPSLGVTLLTLVAAAAAMTWANFALRRRLLKRD